MKKVLLLDIENIQKNEQELVQLLKEYQQVYLVYAKSPTTLTLDGLLTFVPLINEKRLVLVKMPKMGKDSADFGLAFLAGQLSIQLNPDEYNIKIMSNDKALDYVVDLLKIMQFDVEQIKTQTLEPIEIEKFQKQTAVQLEQKMNLAVEALSKNQPKFIKSLYNSLQSWLNLSVIHTRQVVNLLKQRKFISVHEHNVIYHFPLTSSTSTTANKYTQPYAIPSVDEIEHKSNLQHIKYYCDYLYSIDGRRRPIKEKSLAESIQSVMQFEHPQMTISTLNALKKRQIITEQNGRLMYNKDLIQQWAELEINPILPEPKTDTLQQENLTLDSVDETEMTEITAHYPLYEESFIDDDNDTEHEVEQKLHIYPTEKDVYAFEDDVEKVADKSEDNFGDNPADKAEDNYEQQIADATFDTELSLDEEEIVAEHLVDEEQMTEQATSVDKLDVYQQESNDDKFLIFKEKFTNYVQNYPKQDIIQRDIMHIDRLNYHLKQLFHEQDEEVLQSFIKHGLISLKGKHVKYHGFLDYDYY